MVVVIPSKDFFPTQEVCFVEQPSNNEDSILIPATFVIKRLGGWLKSQGRNKPAMKVTKWTYPWPVEDGFLCLRLSIMNDNDGKNFCNFNMNPGNKSDYIECIGYKNTYFYTQIQEDEVASIVNGMVEKKTNVYLHRILLEAIKFQQVQFVTTCKSVFCLKPALPSKLKELGVEQMTDTNIEMWHHQIKKADRVRLGWKDDEVKIPCIDLGGLSNLCFPLNDEAVTSLFQDVECRKFSDDDDFKEWVHTTLDKYLNSRDMSMLTDERFDEVMKSIYDLFN